MAERTGLEPATTGVTGRYSNQLNYRSVLNIPLSLPHSGWHFMPDTDNHFYRCFIKTLSLVKLFFNMLSQTH